MPTEVDRLLDEPLDACRAFESHADETAFWKSRAAEYRGALKETRHDFEEFQSDSKDYEEELEQNIDVLEAQNKELKGLVNMLQIESEHWKQKAKEVQQDAASAHETLHRELTFLRQQQKEHMERTRSLELDNDDLERNGRAMESSRRDLEHRLSSLVERNAFLEHEMEIKQKLVVVVQRLKDELRDLQLELSVLKTKRSSFKRRSVDLVTAVNGSKPSEVDSAAAPGEAPAAAPAQGATNAVRAVQEMLGRVRVLENRLVKCRTLVNPMLQSPQPSSRASRIPTATGGSGNTGIPPRHSMPAMPTARSRGLSENTGRKMLVAASNGSGTNGVLLEDNSVVLDAEVIRQRAAARKQRMDEFERMKRRQSERRGSRSSIGGVIANFGTK